jgi:adenosylcobinamide-phosphate synthase
MLDVLFPLLICIVALILDRLLGEPKYHPLVFFGNIANWFERGMNNRKSKINGAISTLVLIGIPVALVIYLQMVLANTWLNTILSVGVLYFVIGWQSMKQHALAISKPLQNDDLEEARYNLSMIVSRETSNMSESQLVGSTLESVLENGHDCVFASLFWFLLLGPAGALLHRLVNTLDAMWGYRNERYLNFGCFAARLDDLLGYLPARLTGLSYALSGSCKAALASWHKQRGQHKSPNAGLVMASGAGALGIVIGGPAIYDGTHHDKPYLGIGIQAEVKDIARSIALIEKALVIWFIASATILLFLSIA